MRSLDILEELGNLDDELLMRAEIDPPRRHIFSLRSLRSAAAACLVFALILTTLIVTNTFADEMGLRWRVRYREDEVTWLFKDGMEQEGNLPNYEPTWLPEGYVLEQEYYGIVRDKMISYNNLEEDQSWILFDYMRITDKEIYYLSSLDKGTYEKETVEINGLPGELYTFLDEPDSGYLLWIDKRNCIVFLLNFDSGAEDAVKIAESVTQIEEESQE